jgi:hypothetical protein
MIVGSFGRCAGETAHDHELTALSAQRIPGLASWLGPLMSLRYAQIPATGDTRRRAFQGVDAASMLIERLDRGIQFA